MAGWSRCKRPWLHLDYIVRMAHAETPQAAPAQLHYEYMRELRRPVRLESLDAFRGLTIAAMMVVNQLPAKTYSPFEHAEWNGWTHTDLIFPFFLFIAGLSMALSFSARHARGASRADLMLHTLRRAAVIFAIGFLLNLYWVPFHFARLSTVRIPGVLQRIAVAYACAAAIYLLSGLGKRMWLIALATLVLLGGYWAAMMVLGHGDLSPNGNLGARLDTAIFGVRHLWQQRPWDPEGILSTVPAVATALMGALAGELLMSGLSARKKVFAMLLAGAAGLALGEALDPLFPINKNLWSSSYAIFAAGYALVILAACYWLVEVKEWRRWALPLLVFGVNPLFAFAASTFVTKSLLIFHTHGTSVFSWLYARWYQPHFADARNASLAFALTYMLLWMALLAVFYRRGWRIKI